jgi:hypothetical protein
VTIKLTKEFSEPASPPLRTESQPAHRPRFSEKVNQVRIILASNIEEYDNMDDGHSATIYLPIGLQQPLATAKVIDNELVVDAKLGTLGAELKDNRLINNPPGWDWQADDNTFEIVNERGNPVFQLIYLSGNMASIRGVFFDGAECVLVGEQDVVIGRSRVEEVARIRIKPIFKYPSRKYPKEGQ